MRFGLRPTVRRANTVASTRYTQLREAANRLFEHSRAFAGIRGALGSLSKRMSDAAAPAIPKARACSENVLTH